MLHSRFATLNARPTHRDNERNEPRPVERLLTVWPDGTIEPAMYWLSTVPEPTEKGSW
jgi:hypothetical protein